MIEINWRPDRYIKESIHMQIVNYILQNIISCTWKAGEQLPSQRKLAELFHVNRSTIVTAMDELASIGMIQTMYGGGTVISGNAWSVMLSHKQTNWEHYVNTGTFRRNLPEIQKINQYEYMPDIIRLGTGEPAPELFPRILWQQALNTVAANMQSMNYLEPKGLYELRSEIAARLSKKGIHTIPENILITSGSLQALQLISVGMMPKGSKVFTEAPTYLKSLQLFPSAGMILQGIPMDEEGIQYWFLPTKEIGRSILYTIPTNHNPTGVTMSVKRRNELLQYCAKHQIPIVEDSAYDDLWMEEVPPPPLKALDTSTMNQQADSPDTNNNVVYLGTISKTLAPGLRIGWMVGPSMLIDRLSDIKMQMDYGASSLAQWVLLEMFRSGSYDLHLNSLRKELLRRRDAALHALDVCFSELADWSIPQGGFYIWLRLRGNISIDSLFKKALEANILVNPGNVYDFKSNHAIRLSFAYVDSNTFETAIKKLAHIAISLQK